jgi:DNA polymerase-3 subunit gamma/tau
VALIKKKKNNLYQWLDSPDVELTILRDSAEDTPLSVKQPSPKAVEKQPVTKLVKIPKSSPKSISIKDALEGKTTPMPKQQAESSLPVDDEVDDDIADLEVTADEDVIVNQVDLERRWLQFTQSHLAGKPRFASLLTTYQPILGSNLQVKVVFESQLQLDMFTEIQSELTHFLRLKLGSKSVVIEASFQSQPNGNGNGKMYTTEDKFKFLSQKNPKVLNLKQQLNLDFD